MSAEIHIMHPGTATTAICGKHAPADVELVHVVANQNDVCPDCWESDDPQTFDATLPSGTQMRMAYPKRKPMLWVRKVAA